MKCTDRYELALSTIYNYDYLYGNYKDVILLMTDSLDNRVRDLFYI